MATLLENPGLGQKEQFKFELHRQKKNNNIIAEKQSKRHYNFDCGSCASVRSFPVETVELISTHVTVIVGPAPLGGALVFCMAAFIDKSDLESHSASYCLK